MRNPLRKLDRFSPLLFQAFGGTADLGPTGEQKPTVYLSTLFDPNTSLTTFFSKVFYAAIAIGAILAVLQLGRAGFMYMTSDVWSSKQKATEMIQQAVTGLLLLLAVYLILFQINPDILNLDILKSVKSST